MMRRYIIFSIALITLLITSCTDRSLPLLSENGHNGKFAFDIGTLADSTFTIDGDLSTLVRAKLLDQNGTIRACSIEKALECHRKDKFPMPIFEVKNSKQVILYCTGEGLWGPLWCTVMINPETNVISKVKFGHKGETPGVGAEISQHEFADQFKNTKYYPDVNSFKLRNKSTISGEQEIDGITGGTITSVGALTAVNDGLNKYDSYLSKF